MSFDDAYGRTTITVESAGTSETVFKDLTGEPIQSKNGTFVFVTFSKFDSPILGPDSLLELKGADGMLYGPDLSNGPDSGAAMAGFGETDPNHFTEAFDLPKEAASGAVLIVHERGTHRESMGSGISRPVPEGYEDGAHDDLGLQPMPRIERVVKKRRARVRIGVRALSSLAAS